MGMPGNEVCDGKFDQPGMNGMGGMKEMDHGVMAQDAGKVKNPVLPHIALKIKANFTDPYGKRNPFLPVLPHGVSRVSFMNHSGMASGPAYGTCGPRQRRNGAGKLKRWRCFATRSRNGSAHSRPPVGLWSASFERTKNS